MRERKSWGKTVGKFPWEVGSRGLILSGLPVSIFPESQACAYTPPCNSLKVGCRGGQPLTGPRKLPVSRCLRREDTFLWSHRADPPRAAKSSPQSPKPGCRPGLRVERGPTSITKSVVRCEHVLCRTLGLNQSLRTLPLMPTPLKQVSQGSC